MGKIRNKRLTAWILTLVMMLSISGALSADVSAVLDPCECTVDDCLCGTGCQCIPDTCSCGICDPVSQPTFVQVTDITGVPASGTAGDSLTLTGTVVPSDATNNEIVWSVFDDGGTGASISGSTLTTTAVGKVTVRATIANGAAESVDYTQDVSIEILAAAFIPVASITGVPASGTAGNPLALNGTVVPPNATRQTIVWSVSNAGTTNAVISGSNLTATAAGEVTVLATIADGGPDEADFTESFNITISQPNTSFTMNSATGGRGEIRVRPPNSTTWGAWISATPPFTENIQHNSTVELHAANLTSGQGFVHWNVVADGTVSTFTNSNITNRASLTASFTMPNGNVTVAPVFGTLRRVTLTTNTPSGTTAYGTPTAGTGSVTAAGVIDAATDARVNLTAAPRSGISFVHWEVVSGPSGFTNSSITNRTSRTEAYFTMPSGAVEIRAVYGHGYAVTVTRNNNSWGTANVRISTDTENASETSITAAPQQTINLVASPSSGRSFSHWNVLEGDVTINNIYSQTATFTMPERAVRVEAVFRATVGVVSGGGVEVTFTRSGSEISLDMNTNKVRDIINATSGNTVSLTLSDLGGATRATMQAAAITQLANAGMALEISLPQGTVRLNTEAMRSAVSQASGTNPNISISLLEPETNSLTAAQRNQIRSGDKVFSVNMYSGTRAITGFDGALTVTVPYTGQIPVTVWRLSDRGELEVVESTYNSSARTVSFTVDRLSEFLVGMDNRPVEPLHNPFHDIFEHNWFYDDVLFVYHNNLMLGTSRPGEYPAQFDPGLKLSRGMIVTLLHNHAGNPRASNPTNPFSDVPEGQWYTEAIIWAAANGIVEGHQGRFRPNEDVTRQDMMVTFHRYMTRWLQINPTPTLQWGGFLDESEIADYALAALQHFNRLGIISGHANRINPRGTATRAEAAGLIRGFIEMINRQ